MAEENLKDMQIRILGAVQNEIPVCARPFEAIARHLSAAGQAVGEEEVIDTLESLRARNYIRRIGPVFDAAKLGYKSVLAAANVAENSIEEAAAVINSYAGVTHNYLRAGDPYNIWFTVTAENTEEIVRIVDEIEMKLGLDEILVLPAEKTYKIKVGFELGNSVGSVPDQCAN